MPKAEKGQAPDTVEHRTIERGQVEVNGLTMQYEVNVAEGQRVTFATILPNDCDSADIDALFDTIDGSVAKVKARAELPMAESRLVIAREQLLMQQKLAAQTEARHMARHNISRKQGEFHPNEQQANELGGIRTTIARFEADIPILEHRIRQLHAIIAGDPAPELPGKERPRLAAAE